jgi:hypothetical protein
MPSSVARVSASIAAHGAIHIGRVGVRRNLAKSAEAPCLETSLAALVGEAEGALTGYERITEPAREQVRLGQVGENERVVIH